MRIALALILLLLVACTAAEEPAPMPDAPAAEGQVVVPPAAIEQTTPEPMLLPLGDGKVAAAPRQGYIFACETNFRGGGAFHAGDWIEGDSWDPSGKPTVDGSITWPSSFSLRVLGEERIVTGNGLPEHSTGTYPIAPADDAYAYDRNPNSIQENEIALTLPLHPELAAEPSCVPMGMIGVLTSGAALFNGFDDAGRDAVAHEIQDTCDGHPQQQGVYHYHGESPCLPDTGLVGYALDGFPIYGSVEDGRELTNADLDDCHGKTVDGEYRYYLTREYPYSIGCFMGTPAVSAHAQPQGNPQQGPPAEATAACMGKNEGVPCAFQAPDRRITGMCRTTPSGMACVPA